ncbi:DUF2796 domain-containing protein [Rhizobium sp. BK538]|uniref:DUF2796 domain-containing protein n=1 Tax=Rhizobium sp. BK538 TaxID=2586984 RepID=UPI00161703F4|nr:DUF2796 domain-containing protein [Rhizobium sp. BK538]MBB4170559.1 hypothetical protein [Rhizobium sp. BK538]
MGLNHRAGALIAAGMLGVASTGYAKEEHRELGPHVHGHGTLAIAFEANNLQMELTAPGMDIVGFEHEAETDEQKKAVETAIDDLKEPLKFFSFPDSAGCKVTAADVKLVAEAHEEHEAAAKTEGAATEEHDDHHDEFRATYTLACTDAAQVTSIEFPFFDRFTGSEELDVTVIDAKGQTAFEVSRESRRLDR